MDGAESGWSYEYTVSYEYHTGIIATCDVTCGGSPDIPVRIPVRI